MIPSSPICNVCEYSQCGDKCPPTAEQAAKGLNPLGAVPSQLWNSLWHDANAAVNCIKFASDTLMCEINSVLTEAGISPDALCTNQFVSAITCLLQAVDSTGGKSSVKSSTTPGMVSIDANGFMTANCVGNANNLTTTNRVIVDAANEINSTYGNAYDTLWQNTYDIEEAKADNNHASCDTDYGVGTASIYGHLKISDVCCAVLPDCGNVAASQKALADIWAYVNSTTGLGNVPGYPVGSSGASPGVCTTAARSDHVHNIVVVPSARMMAQSWSCVCVYTCDKISLTRLLSLGLMSIVGCPARIYGGSALQGTCLISCRNHFNFFVLQCMNGRYGSYCTAWACATCWGCWTDYATARWCGPRDGKVCFICDGNPNDYCNNFIPLVAGDVYIRDTSWCSCDGSWTTCAVGSYNACMIQIAHKCLPAICCVCLMKPATPARTDFPPTHDLDICFVPKKYFLGRLLGPMPYIPF